MGEASRGSKGSQLDHFFHGVEVEPVQMERVAAEVLEQVPPPAELLLLAGSVYLGALHTPLLAADRYQYSNPLAGKAIGQQLAWLKSALAELDEEAARG